MTNRADADAACSEAGRAKRGRRATIRVAISTEADEISLLRHPQGRARLADPSDRDLNRNAPHRTYWTREDDMALTSDGTASAFLGLRIIPRSSAAMKNEP